MEKGKNINEYNKRQQFCTKPHAHIRKVEVEKSRSWVAMKQQPTQNRSNMSTKKVCVTGRQSTQPRMSSGLSNRKQILKSWLLMNRCYRGWNDSLSKLTPQAANLKHESEELLLQSKNKRIQKELNKLCSTFPGALVCFRVLLLLLPWPPRNENATSIVKACTTGDSEQ